MPQKVIGLSNSAFFYFPQPPEKQFGYFRYITMVDAKNRRDLEAFKPKYSSFDLGYRYLTERFASRLGLLRLRLLCGRLYRPSPRNFAESSAERSSGGCIRGLWRPQ